MIFYKNKGGSLHSHSDWRPTTLSWGQPRLHTELSYCCLLTNEVRWNICHFSFRLLIGRIDAEAETPILWPPDLKNWLIGKDPDLGTDWKQEEKGMTEDEMVGWHHQLDGHEFEQAPWVGDGQGGLACCSPRSHKESDTTEWLNWIYFHDQFWKLGLSHAQIINQSILKEISPEYSLEGLMLKLKLQ